MPSHQPPICLSIAGSDSGAGAGIQADLKTFAALGVYGTTAITAVTAQNTLTLKGIWPQPVAAVVAQIDAVMQDFDVGAIKLGMLYSADIVEAICACLDDYPAIPVVCDPVLVATSGASLAGQDLEQQRLVQAIEKYLLPRSALLTPNIDEASVLLASDAVVSGRAQSLEDMYTQCQALIKKGAQAVLLKGGHLAFSANQNTQQAIDVLCWHEANDGDCGLKESGGLKENGDAKKLEIKSRQFAHEHIDSSNTHGTGCSLSSAIAALLAKGLSLPEAVAQAKDYVHAAIAAGKNVKLGRGSGPIQHFHQFQ